MALSTSIDTRLDGDIQQLQRLFKGIQTDMNELSLNVTRLTNLLQQVIKLNSLKSKP